MSGAVHSYTPGGALAICGPRVVALVDLPPDAGLVSGLYDLIGGGSAGLDEVLELLVTPGLRAIQNFALAEGTDEGLRTVVRGSYRAEAGTHAIEGRGLWTDRIVQADKFTLVDPNSSGSPTVFPLPGGGVVLASRLHGRLDEANSEGGASSTDGPQPPTAGVAAGAAADASGPQDGAVETGAEDPAAPSGQPSPADAPSPDADRPAEGNPPAAQAEESDENRPAEGEPGQADQPDLAAGGPEARQETTEGGTGHTLPTPFTSPITDLPSPPPSPARGPSGQPTFIDALPWSEPDGQDADAGPATQPFTPDLVSSGESAERTVNRDSLPQEGVQTVVAARCPAGHLSPAYAGNCRVCNQPLAPQQPVEIPRPPLGVLRLSNGDTVVLDRGCILGRNPRVPAGLAGEQPNLVKLIDPDKDISGQHLEVRLEYWHVAIKDLGSTNGTQVVLPGENPVTLRPNDPMMIEPGTKVILAGVFSFTFEVTP